MSIISNSLRYANRAAKRSTPILSSQRQKSSYEGEGKMTVRIMNQEQDLGLMIDSYSTFGFRLNNGISVLGPIAIFARTVLSWQVPTVGEINEASLRLFKLLEPRVDLVIFGLETSDRASTDAVFRSARSLGINFEILKTENACSTFNFLNAEGRCVAAALIPPLKIDSVSDDDMLRSKIHYENLFNKEI